MKTVAPVPPPPPLESYVTDSTMRSIKLQTYSATQMREYGDARVRAALEAAIEICEADDLPYLANEIKGLMP